MSENLDTASWILANAELLACHAVVDGRTASNPHFVRDQKRMIIRMMGEKIAEKLDPLALRFIKERGGNEALYGPASLELTGEIVVLTKADLDTLTRIILTEQRRAEMPRFKVGAIGASDGQN